MNGLPQRSLSWHGRNWDAMSELSAARQALRDYANEGSGAFERYTESGSTYWVGATRRDHAARVFGAVLAVLEVVEDERQTYDGYTGPVDPGDYMVIALLDKLDAAIKEALSA